MSYSYIKSVFPNFKAPVYEYAEAKIPVSKPQPPTSPLMAYNDQELAQFVKNLLQKTPAPAVVAVEDPVPGRGRVVNNRVFTQPPVPELYLKNAQPVESVFDSSSLMSHGGGVESFGNEMSPECARYMYHALNCKKCRHILRSQLGVEVSQRGKTDVVEILTYLVLGMLVLMIIDHFRGKK
jgi:hypothetical protein